MPAPMIAAAIPTAIHPNSARLAHQRRLNSTQAAPAGRIQNKATPITNNTATLVRRAPLKGSEGLPRRSSS